MSRILYGAMRRYAYLHGFGSGPLSKKGVRLAGVFEQRGLVLERPDLNRPSFATLSPAASLAAIDALDAAKGQAATWCFIGSSIGGWLAARWAEQHPDRVERMVLLCPGFDLASRWPKIVGAARMERWKRDGTLLFPDADGRPVPVHYGFYEEGISLPQEPVVSCPTVILHAIHDEVVPVEVSRRYAAKHPNVRLREIDDDHSLMASVDIVIAETLECFSLTEA